MTDTESIKREVEDILDKLDHELHKVANRDNEISHHEQKFLSAVDSRTHKLQEELNHIFEDKTVTKEERKNFYQKLGAVFDDAIKVAKEDDRIDHDEIFLITKLKTELSDIISRLDSIVSI